ncbi:hypothetical protein BASA83_012724 [Batrachochytrium salamandrivorans]|nr:hypothetical protein BASA83_012724 [Batrachochytrium salamandrivorans]
MSIVEPEKKNRKLVDLSTKLVILKYLDDGHSIRATADKFKLSKGTVQSAKQNRENHDRVVARLVAPILQEKAKQIATQIGADVASSVDHRKVERSSLILWNQHKQVQDQILLQPLDAGIIQSLKALSRKFEVLSLLDLMKDSSIHASDLAKNTDSSGRNQVYVEILGPSYGRDNPEMFCQMRFCCPSNSTE